MAASKLGEKFPDMDKPVEYKERPIRFTFILDNRKEPVKVVEPKVDLPFPEGGRLVVDEAKDRICDVVFQFDPEAQKPYRLNFSVLDRVRHDGGRLETYGAGVARESDMRAVYRKAIVDCEDVHADIEMSHGKARLVIQYRKDPRIPKDLP